jgi:hypothetical protein
MGVGAAALFALHGSRVTLVVRRAAAAETGRERVDAHLRRLSQLGVVDSSERERALGRVETSLGLNSGETYGLVFEAISEAQDAKRSVLAEAERVLGQDGIMASMTSSIPSRTSSRALRPIEVRRMALAKSGLSCATCGNHSRPEHLVAYARDIGPLVRVAREATDHAPPRCSRLCRQSTAVRPSPRGLLAGGAGRLQLRGCRPCGDRRVGPPMGLYRTVRNHGPRRP